MISEGEREKVITIFINKLIRTVDKIKQRNDPSR